MHQKKVFFVVVFFSFIYNSLMEGPAKLKLAPFCSMYMYNYTCIIMQHPQACTYIQNRIIIKLCCIRIPLLIPPPLPAADPVHADAGGGLQRH